jgi:hypothetical protein
MPLASERRLKQHWAVTLIALITGVFGAVVSAYNFYSQRKPAELSVYANVVIDYNAPSAAACGVENFEVMVVPFALLNNGGQTGIITQLRIKVSDVDRPGVQREFVAAGIGVWRPNPPNCAPEGLHPFAPIAIRGGEAIRESIVFFSLPSQARVIQPNSKYHVAVAMRSICSDFLGNMSSEGEVSTVAQFDARSHDYPQSFAAERLIGLTR